MNNNPGMPYSLFLEAGSPCLLRSAPLATPLAASLAVPGGGLAVVGLAGLAFLSYLAYRVYHRHRGQLAAQKQEIDTLHQALARQDRLLNKQQAHIKRLSQLKSELGQVASHEAAPTLNVIMGLACMPPSQKRLQRIHDHSREMLLLLLSTQSAHRLEQARQQAGARQALQQVGDVLQRVMPQVMPLIEAKGLHYQLQGHNYSFWAPAPLVAQVLVNLFNYAIGQTRPGGHLSLAIAPHCGALRFALTATGSGRPAEALPHIFEPAPEKALNPVLGLPFCGQAIVACGGQIGGQPTKAGGTTLWFTLPWEAAGTPSPLSLHQEVAPPPAMAQPLTRQDLDTLQPLLPLLQSLRVNQLTEAKAVLKSLKPGSPGLTQWKNALIDALYACDAEAYDALVGQQALRKQA